LHIKIYNFYLAAQRDEEVLQGGDGNSYHTHVVALVAAHLHNIILANSSDNI
jgi:hypothetical protein